jgi:hypothetical protein
MFNDKKELFYGIFIYIFSLIILWIAKPSLCFNEEGKVKNWGVGKNKTMYPIFIISLSISIISLFLMISINN